jgi:plastocyanin
LGACAVGGGVPYLKKIPFAGTKTTTLKLKAGTYKYHCPNHESIMFGHFRVT